LEYFGINIKTTKIAMMMLTSTECAKDIKLRWEVSLRANLHAPEERRISCHKDVTVL